MALFSFGPQVHGCIDMLLKEFSQLFAGPGGSLMGITNSNNLDRIRIFNQYHPPSIDQIEDEQDMEGKMASEEYYDDDDEDYDEYGDYGSSKSAGREELINRKADKVREKIRNLKANGRRNKLDLKKLPKKRENFEDSREDANVSWRSNKRNKSKSKVKSEDKRPLLEGLGIFQRKPIPAYKTSSYQSLDTPRESLYDLEPKNNMYDSKKYTKNAFDDDDGDMNTFQTRDEASNVPKSKKMKQPIIDMMVKILDTMQLTSKHDYKRAKEKELRDQAREELVKMHGS